MLVNFFVFDRKKDLYITFAIVVSKIQTNFSQIFLP